MADQFLSTMRDFEDAIFNSKMVYDYYMRKETYHYVQEELIKQRNVFNIRVRFNNDNIDEIEKIKQKAMVMADTIKTNKIYPIVNINFQNINDGCSIFCKKILA